MSSPTESYRTIIMDLSELTHEDKIKYMSMACAMLGINIGLETTDMLVSVYDLVIKHKGQTDMEMVYKLQAEVKKRADIREKGEMLGKASKKNA